MTFGIVGVYVRIDNKHASLLPVNTSTRYLNTAYGRTTPLQSCNPWRTHPLPNHLVPDTARHPAYGHCAWAATHCVILRLLDSLLSRHLEFLRLLSRKKSQRLEKVPMLAVLSLNATTPRQRTWKEALRMETTKQRAQILESTNLSYSRQFSPKAHGAHANPRRRTAIHFRLVQHKKALYREGRSRGRHLDAPRHTQTMA